MGEASNWVAARGDVRPINQWRRWESVPDRRGGSEWDFEEFENLGIEGRLGGS